MTVASKRSTWLVFAAVPVLGPGYQYCVERIAQATLDQPFGLGWLTALFMQPWALGVIALEIGSFIAWMIVLSRWPISAAFPLTAVSYGLVVGVGWIVFHEPVRPLEILGAAIILTGFFLLSPRAGETPEHAATNPPDPSLSPGVSHASD